MPSKPGNGAWLATLVTLPYILGFGQACPAACVCKWKGGKQTVECINKDLLTLPEGIDPSTQVLEFAGNNLQTLAKERFQKMGLINLQRIYLSRCQIGALDDRAFAGLTNLVDLDLSKNLLATVPTETFADYPSLMRLVLNNNPIKALRRSSFHHLSYLTTLELSSCEIEQVEDGAFHGLDSLEWLKIDGNRLTTIRGSQILPETLHGIDLHNNRWQCDCRMLELYAWLNSFKVPHMVEAECSSPPRLARQTLKSIQMSDLACLPDVSPTTLYLEIGEGKNVSLLCKVSAVPEAHVSWWFEGQVLQNDSIVAPGLHLYYYIEEGKEDKKSELFIYNTNADDNGTFVCTAENSAGKAQSNFTIRIIVKEEPVVIVVSFPFEYFLAIVAGAVVLGIVLIITIIVSIVKCKRNRKRRKKKERSKEVALQNQNTVAKCPVLRGTTDTADGTGKVNGSALITEHQQEMIMYAGVSRESLARSISPVNCSGQFKSPPKSFHQLEQNPDLINDTDKTKRHDGDGEDDQEAAFQEAADTLDELASVSSSITRQVQWQDLQYPQGAVRAVTRDMYQHAVDVHLNPGCLVDSEGYPVDYGLPKVPLRHPLPADQASNFYRTLPHNRAAKRVSAANPMSRYSREAEFLSRTAQQPASYEHYYSQDVRYTADGYPKQQQAPGGKLFANGPCDCAENSFVPSPPEAYKSDGLSSPASLPCCVGSTANNQWLPAGLHKINPVIVEANQSRFANISKRCVGAQTESRDPAKQDDAAPAQAQASTSTAAGSAGRGSSLTESPDEGYEGETVEPTEI